MTAKPSSAQPLNAGDTLLAYVEAFSARNCDAIGELFGAQSLAELPLLKPNRLVGHAEICAGHAAAFENIADARFTQSQPIANTGSAAIWVGQLRELRTSGAEHEHDVAIVCETAERELRRITVHLNGRNIRRWADQTIL